MRAWQTNTIIVLVTLGLIFFLPPEYTSLVSIVVVLTTIWVYTDAVKIDLKKYKSNFGGPGSAAFFVFIIWIIAFPLYISTRQKIKEGKTPLREASNNNPQQSSGSENT